MTPRALFWHLTNIVFGTVLSKFCLGKNLFCCFTRKMKCEEVGSNIFGTFSFFKLSFKVRLLKPSPRGPLIYERFIKLSFNTQGRDSYLNELVYAELRWQIMLKVIAQ